MVDRIRSKTGRAGLLLAAALLLVSASCSYYLDPGYYELPALGKEAMYADYDFMARIIADVSPFIELQRQAYGMDMLRILADRRPMIESIQNTGAFYLFVRVTLGSLKSQHLDPWTGFSPPDTGVLDSLLREDLIFKERYDLSHDVDYYLPLWYWNGRYILTTDVVAKGTAIPSLSVLDAIDGGSPYDATELYQPHSTQSYDFTNRRFYGSVGNIGFYMESAAPGGHRFRFAPPSGGTVEVDLAARDTIVSASSSYAGQSDPVQYFAGHRALYIKLGMMDETLVEGFFPRIKSESAKGPVDRIVIDITDNPGGSDMAWMKLLSMLLDHDVAAHAAVGFRDTAEARAALQAQGMTELLAGSPTRVAALGGQTFIKCEGDNLVSKRSDSIGFTGPIYLVAFNIYSAAGSFLAYAAQDDQITSIGVPSDLPLGMGISPLIYTLPISGLRFRIEPVIDLGRPDTIDGLLGREVEVPIAVSDADFLAYVQFRGDLRSEDFVCGVNPFTRAAFQQ